MHFLAFFEKYFGLNKALNFSIFTNLAFWQQAHKRFKREKPLSLKGFF